MEAREANMGRLKLLPITSGAEFVWTTWRVFLGDAANKQGVKEILVKVIAENETAAAKIKRIKDDSAKNSIALSMLYEVCQSDAIATTVVTQQAASEVNPCAQTLWKLLEERFSQRTNLRVQALLKELNSITMRAHETAAKFCDRYTTLKTSIMALSPTQLPSELARKGVLLSAIVTAFPVLWALLCQRRTTLTQS